jgi:hypothetical protein
MRRGARRLGVATVLVSVLVLLAGPGRAAAHGGAISLTLHPARTGVVDVTVLYADKDPVDEPVQLLLTASKASGERYGPVPVLSTGRPGLFRSMAPLPPGSWRVVVATVAGATPAKVSGAVVVPARAGVQTPTAQATAAPSPLPTTVALTARRTAGSWPLGGPAGWIGAGLVLAVAAALVSRRLRRR